MEELAHAGMIGLVVYQLTSNLSIDEIKKSGFNAYFVDHTSGRCPFTAAVLQSKGDGITDLVEDLAAEPAIMLNELHFTKYIIFQKDSHNLRLGIRTVRQNQRKNRLSIPFFSQLELTIFMKKQNVLSAA